MVEAWMLALCVAIGAKAIEFNDQTECYRERYVEGPVSTIVFSGYGSMDTRFSMLSYGDADQPPVVFR